jgi:hypothetical protein
MTNICRRFYSIFRAATFFACVTFSSELFAVASNQYCNNDMTQHHLDFNIGKLQNAPLDSGAVVTFSRDELNTGMIASSEQDHAMAIGFNFQYTIFGFNNNIQPMTNGHLHSWNFPVSWRSKGTDYTLDYYLAPVISVSSNSLKNPALLERDSMQLWTGMIYKKKLNMKSAWLIGFRSDHRFGPYRVYPVAGFCWQANTNWQLQLALPDFSIRRSFSNGINIKLFAQPDGNKWHVFSKDETIDSDFIYNAIVTGLSIEWRIKSTVKLELSAVKHSRREFSFALEDGTQVETGAKSSTGLVVSAGIVF